MSADLEQLKKWIGARESDIDYVTVPAVHRLAATLDLDYPMPKMGDPLPIGLVHDLLSAHRASGAGRSRRASRARRLSTAGPTAAAHVRGQAHDVP